MGRDAGAATLTVVAQSVILTDDLVALDATKTQRSSAVIADIASGRHRAIGDPVDNDTFVQQPRGQRLVRHFMRVGYWIPEGSERSPVGLGEAAAPRQGSRQAVSLKIRGRNKGSGRSHGSLWPQRSIRINPQVSEVIVLLDVLPDDLGNLFKQAFILPPKGREIVAVDVDLADDLSMGVNRDDNLRFCLDRAREISRIGADIIDNHRLTGSDSSPADA